MMIFSTIVKNTLNTTDTIVVHLAGKVLLICCFINNII